MTTEKLWTLDELSRKFKPKLSVSTWRRMIRERKIAATRIGSGRGMLYVKESELQKLTTSESN